MSNPHLIASATVSFLLLIGADCAFAQSYIGELSGAAESPPNASPGTGTTTVAYAGHTLQVDVNFSGLLANTTAAHIHCCIAPPGTAGVATPTPSFPGFPLSVTSGTYSNSFNLTLASSFNPSFVTAHGGTTAAAEAALTAGLANGQAYLNIHTTAFGGGELRAFLVPRDIFIDGFEGN